MPFLEVIRIHYCAQHQNYYRSRCIDCNVLGIISKIARNTFVPQVQHPNATGHVFLEKVDKLVVYLVISNNFMCRHLYRFNWLNYYICYVVLRCNCYPLCICRNGQSQCRIKYTMLFNWNKISVVYGNGWIHLIRILATHLPCLLSPGSNKITKVMSNSTQGTT